jgi:sulfonate transport system substrate-binding protein
MQSTRSHIAHLPRRRFLAAATLAGTAATLLPRRTRAAGLTFHVAAQKIGPILILRQRKLLEDRLAPMGVAVEWSEFSTGAAMLEAVSAGSIDFGQAGDSGPIFAQAGGKNITYVGYEPSPGRISAILVPEGSPINNLADLKGKRIAFSTGSSAHYVVLAALQRANLSYSDITPVILGPADAMAAFQGRSIDAWSIWDPFYALAEVKYKARVLTTAVGLAPSNAFLMSSPGFVKAHPEVIKTAVAAMHDAGAWAKANNNEFAAIMAEATGLPPDVAKLAAERTDFDYSLMSDAPAVQQQQIADTFFAVGLLPKKVAVRDLFWIPNA